LVKIMIIDPNLINWHGNDKLSLIAEDIEKDELEERIYSDDDFEIYENESECCDAKIYNGICSKCKEHAE
jgi:hypothetical protein